MDNREIFISYTKKGKGKGKDYAQELATRIISNTKFRVFRDDDTLLTGDLWKAEIDRAIEDCFALVVVVTTEAAEDSKWVTYEWSYALGLGKQVLPLVFEKEAIPLMHDKLRDSLNRDDKFISPTEETWQALLTMLTRIYEETHVPHGIERAIEAAEDFEPQRRDLAIDFLLKNTHSSSFDALVRLCDYFLDETQAKASIALVKKVKKNIHNPELAPSIMAINGFFSKAINGLIIAIDWGNQAGKDARELLAYIDTPEAATAVWHSFQATMNYHLRESRFDVLLKFNKSAIPYFIEAIQLEHNYKYASIQKLTELNYEPVLEDIAAILLNLEERCQSYGFD